VPPLASQFLQFHSPPPAKWTYKVLHNMSESEFAHCVYHITSKKTNFHFTNYNEIEGHDVVTSNSVQSVRIQLFHVTNQLRCWCSFDQGLTITPCVTGSVTDHATITGPKGLYVALAKVSQRLIQLPSEISQWHRRRVRVMAPTWFGPRPNTSGSSDWRAAALPPTTCKSLGVCGLNKPYIWLIDVRWDV